MIKVGVLGTGFGKVHAHIYKGLEGVQVTGIFGRTQETLDRLKNELNVNVTTDADELINDSEIDLIDVCLPTSVHKEYVIKALEKKKHVFCETPVSYSLEDAAEMKRCAEENQKELLVDLFYKFSDPHKMAIEKIRSYSLGNPLVTTAYQKTPPHWGDMDFSKIVHDFLIHNFDFITEIMGTPIEVTANGMGNGNSHVFSTLKYQNGIASVESSTMLPYGFPFSIGFNIIGELGTLTFSGEFSEKGAVQKMTVYHSDRSEEVSLPGKDDYEEAIKHVIGHVSHGRSGSCLSIDEAIKSLKTALAVKESLNNQCSVQFK